MLNLTMVLFFRQTEDDDNNNSRKTEDGSEGIVVSKVMEGGSAEKTGLQVNDHIVKVS